MISVISRETGDQRVWGGDRADTRTCHHLMAENVPGASAILSTDEWQSSRGRHMADATVRHGVHEGARDEDGDGHREVHSHACEGAGAALRTYLRALRGVHKRDLHLSVATYEALVNTTGATPHLIQRLCFTALSGHIGYT